MIELATPLWPEGLKYGRGRVGGEEEKDRRLDDGQAACAARKAEVRCTEGVFRDWRWLPGFPLLPLHVAWLGSVKVQVQVLWETFVGRRGASVQAFHARGSGKAPPRPPKQARHAALFAGAGVAGGGKGESSVQGRRWGPVLALSRCTSNSVPLRPPSPRTELVVPACASLVREAGSSPGLQTHFLLAEVPCPPPPPGV